LTPSFSLYNLSAFASDVLHFVPVRGRLPFFRAIRVYLHIHAQAGISAVEVLPAGEPSGVYSQLAAGESEVVGSWALHLHDTSGRGWHVAFSISTLACGCAGGCACGCPCGCACAGCVYRLAWAKNHRCSDMHGSVTLVLGICSQLQLLCSREKHCKGTVPWSADGSFPQPYGLHRS